MKIILASASPRRIELLKQFKIEFESIPSHIEETVRLDENPSQIVMGLAYEKALEVAKQYPDQLIIASDTIVYYQKVLGKPNSYEEAKSMLEHLSGSTHSVYTGIALIHLESSRKVIGYEKTEVTFRVLSEREITSYLDTGEPFDKAGAYGIQGYGALLVSHITGDFYNVMGLPLSKLNTMLSRNFGIELL
jgi:septum formation protein